MNSFKRVSAILLTMCLLVGMITVPAQAADGQFTISAENKTVSAGQTVSVSVDVADNPGLNSLTVYVYYATDIFECTEATANSSGWNMADAYPDNAGVADQYVKEGYKIASFSLINMGTNRANASIGTMTLRAKSDLETCTSDLLVEIAAASGSNSLPINGNTKSGKITINGVTPTLESVSLANSSVTVAGGDAAAQTVQATAISAKGSSITDGATWSVTPAGQGVSVSSSGLVLVTAKAKAGDYTIKAGAKGSTAQGSAETTLVVARETAAIAGISLNPTAVTVRGGDAAAQEIAVSAVDQYDDSIAISSLSVSGEDTANVTAADGKISVAAKAKAGSYTVTGDGKTASFTVTRATAAAAGVTISGGASTIDVPSDGAQANTTTFTAAVADQFDDAFGGTVTWTVAPATAGVSIDGGVLTVSNEAKSAIADTTGMELTVTAKCGTASAEQKITIKRAGQTATAVKLYRNNKELGATDVVVMPVAGGETKTYTYTAKLFDQYGAEIEGQSVSWSAGTIADSEHATFNAGTLAVKAGATKGGTVELTATISGKSEKVTVTVTDVDVNWTAVDAALKTSGITYGQPNSAAFNRLPSTGTATAGEANLSGSFSVVDATEVQGAGAKKVTVQFTVMTAGEYKDVSVTKEYGVNVAKKAVTVTADNKSKTYGEENPELTFTVPGGALVGEDTKTNLGVSLTCAATGTSPAGTPVEITGSAVSDNYEVTVRAGRLTINKATITGVATTAADKTLLANAAENTDLEALTAHMALPTNATVTYGEDKTENLPVTWTADRAFNQKGAVYTFTGRVTVGTNFNTTTQTDTAALTVTPVRITAIGTVPETLTLSKAQATGAADLAALGLPAQVTLTFDNGVSAQTVDAVFDRTLANVQSVANSVTATADRTSVVTLTASGFPAWATLDTTLPKSTLTITNKYVIPETDITFEDINATFGTPYTPSASVASKPEYEGVTYTYTYSKDGRVLATAPTDAGSYSVTVTAENDNYKGSATATLTIAPKAISGVEIDLPENFSATYNKAEHKPVVTVKDGEATLTLNKDYTVAYSDNTNAGTAAITITGKGNYSNQTTATKTFEIAKASLAEMKPTIVGTAAAGKVLTARLANVAADEITWTWTVGGATSAGLTYEVKETDSNKTITVKATAATNKNYDGSTLDSASVTAAKVAVSGTITVTETNKVDGEEGKIEIGDTLTAAATVTPNVAVTYQWYNNGTAIEDATSATYIVADGDSKLTVIATPDENYAGSITSTAVEVGKSVLKGSVTISSATDDEGQQVLTVAVTAGAATESDYTIAWLRNGEVISGQNGTTYTVTKADLGKTISVKISAKGDSYTGELVSAGTTIPATKPDAPVARTAGGNGQVTVSWTVPADNGAPITKYTVQKDAETPIEVGVDSTSYTFTGLTNGTEYTFKVVAINSVGSSDPSAEVKATPKASTSFGGGGSSSAGSDTDESDIEVSTDANGDVTATVPTEKNDDGSCTATISDDAGKKLIEEANKAEGASIVITPDVDEETKKVTVELPASVVGDIAGSKADDAVVRTPVADITMTSETLDALGKTADKTVSVTAEETETGTVSVTVAADGEKLDTIIGGLIAKIPVAETAESGTVAVIVNPDGTEKVIRNSVVVDGKMVTRLDGSATIKIEDRHKSFEDTENHWAKNNVDFVAARELFNGTSATRFSPDGEMTRGMLATVLYRLDGERKSEEVNPFADVTGDIWYSDAAVWGAETGVVKGIDDTTFAPDDYITREQMCTMLYRYAKLLGLNVGVTAELEEQFDDADEVSNWASEAVRWAVKVGIVQGKGDNLLDPLGNATRAEVAAILERFVKYSVQ